MATEVLEQATEERPTHGVREYWIEDAGDRTITQLLLRKKHYALTELGEANTIKSVVLAGFEVTVGELFDA